MNKIEWNHSFLLGFHEVDAHHRHLVELLTRTHDEFIASTQNLGPILDELVDYTQYHFKSEELWMLDGLYPEIAGHKKEHATFLHKALQLQKYHHSKSRYISLELIEFLEVWIANHILITDAKFARYLSRDADL
jgi:hemerythrin